MIEREDIVAAMLRAAGGQIISRVRLQKAAYLLDQLGLKSGFRYEYHHYGPYSRDVDSAVADAKAFGVATESYAHRQSDGAMYSIFDLKDAEPKEEAYGDLGAERAAAIMTTFAATNITVLELAATAHWLWKFENCEDWRAEIARRKAVKVQGGRLDRAVDLLDDLGLRPPSTA